MISLSAYIATSILDAAAGGVLEPPPDGVPVVAPAPPAPPSPATALEALDGEPADVIAGAPELDAPVDAGAPPELDAPVDTGAPPELDPVVLGGGLD
ncbi:MAG TPA: hypothetical protein VHC69_34025 [Polyangiaceae bacterium]|nr:hypothetical protein [Polyangiaceae bacterium]